MRPSAWFKCIRGCPERHPLASVIYRCPSCDALLEVEHDLEALRARAPADWRTLLRERAVGPWPHRSGVWSKWELVQPEVAPENIVSLGEGNQALLPATRYGASIGLEALYVKHCGTSHTGSFKDLGMTVLVSSVKQMIADGGAVRAVACASTGDTSAALAAYGAAAGIPVIVLLPAGKISAAQLLQPIAHGALVCSLDTDFDGCMRVVQRLTHDPSLYLANSLNSLRVEGQKTIAAELLEQLDWELPDWVLVPGGNLGNVSAIAKGFRELRALGLVDRLPRLVCCQAAQANPLYRAFERARAAGRAIAEEDYAAVEAKTTQASAIQIGAPVSLPKAIKALVDTDGLVAEASEAELADAAARADRCGLFTCPHTGVALACLEKLVGDGTIAKDARVVVISTAHGLKFSEFKTRYHQRQNDFPSAYANDPVVMGADPEEVVGAIHRLLDAAAS
ncbi:MAG: threonine synthase [Nannocystaceae bacterium]